MFNRKVVGHRIQSLRLERNWSQEELAEKAGISSTCAGEIERADKATSIENLEKVATALDTSLAGLLSYSEHLDKVEHPYILINLIDKLAKRSIDEQKEAYKIIKALLDSLDRMK